MCSSFGGGGGARSKRERKERQPGREPGEADNILPTKSVVYKYIFMCAKRSLSMMKM